MEHRVRARPRLSGAAGSPAARAGQRGAARHRHVRDRGVAAMTRSDNDTWDIATSVGATAVMVALARASETNSDDPLIRDEFAEPLVSTPELEGVREQVAAWWASEPDDDDPDSRVDSQQMINYQAVRTHFFDAYFADAVAGGIRQVVILAAGLD